MQPVELQILAQKTLNGPQKNGHNFQINAHKFIILHSFWSLDKTDSIANTW